MPHRPSGSSTRCVHAGRDRRKGGLALSLSPASVYAFDSLADVDRPLERSDEVDVYARYRHPTGRAVEEHLACLAGAEDALLFSSGMAALTETVLASCSAGDHLLASSETYGGTTELLRRVVAAGGVEVEFVPFGELGMLGKLVRPSTRLVFVESPSNPLLHLVDFESLFASLGDTRPPVALDATLATPLGQDAVQAGFDLILHSATKYLGGHDDLVAGAVLGRRERLAPLRARRRITGTNCGPHTAWLLGRGMSTLALRWERQCANALELARRLEAHPSVPRVHYPGLSSHPNHALALRQFPDFGAILAFEAGPDLDAARRVHDALRLVVRAPSLGGVESQVLHPATASHRALSAEERERIGIPDRLLRLSVGIEDVEDLWADLEQALGSTPG